MQAIHKNQQERAGFPRVQSRLEGKRRPPVSKLEILSHGTIEQTGFLLIIMRNLASSSDSEDLSEDDQRVDEAIIEQQETEIV